MRTLALASVIAGLAAAILAPAASASTCPSSIAPVKGGYGDSETAGLDDGTPGDEPLWSPGQLIVSLKRSAGTAELRCVARELGATIIEGDRSSDGLADMRNTMVLQLDPGVSVAATVRRLEQPRYEGLVRYASPNYTVETAASPTREPLYPVQWGLGNRKTIPKKTAPQELLDYWNDPNAPQDEKDEYARKYMKQLNFQAPFPDAERFLTPETFVEGRMPFSIQAERAWAKMPTDGFFSLGPSTVRVGVIDSGLAKHAELDSAVSNSELSRVFKLDRSGYQVTVLPGVNGTYRLSGRKEGLGTFKTCPIDVAATPAQVEGWLNRLGVLCSSPDIVTVGVIISADGGTFSIRTGTGRVVTGIPWNVEPDRLEEAIRTRLGLGRDDVSVARPAGSTLAVSFPRATYDQQQFFFDGSGLKSGAGAGQLNSTPLNFQEFAVSSPPAGERWNYLVQARDGRNLSLDRLVNADKLRIEEGGGVRRTRTGTKWVGDPIGHGTFVSGVIAANPTNRTGMSGVMNNNAVNLAGFSALSGGSAVLASAITYAADDFKADVVNISLGWGNERILSTDPPWPKPKKLADPDPMPADAAMDAMGRVTNKETLFVVSAGNESMNAFDPGPVLDPILARNDRLVQTGRRDEVESPRPGPYPCRPKNAGRRSLLQMPDGTYDRGNIICVASANWYGEPSNFTNWGAGIVDVAAPGENMVGPDASDGASFGVGNGTSYSAPVVAGIAAMIKQKYSGINDASIIKCAILSSATTRSLVIAGDPPFNPWKEPFKAYADKGLFGEEPGKLPVGKRAFTVNGMVQADEALSAAGSLWSRYQRAVRKGTALPKCVQQRGPSRLFGKGKWVDAPDLPPGF